MLDQEDQDEGISPSPLKRHPWALHMGPSNIPIQRPLRRAQLHGSTSMPDISAEASGEEPMQESLKVSMPAWLREPSKQARHRPHGAAVRSEASDQHSWRPSPGEPSGPDSQEQWSPGPSALNNDDMDPPMQPEAAAEGSAPQVSEPGAAAEQGGSGSGGSAEDDPQEPQDFHSLAHIPRFARLASKTVDRIVSQQPIQHPTARPNNEAQGTLEAAPEHGLKNDGRPHLEGLAPSSQQPNRGIGRGKAQTQRVQQHKHAEAPRFVAAQNQGGGNKSDAVPADGRHQTAAGAGPAQMMPSSQAGAARKTGLGRGRGRGSRNAGKGRSTMTKRATAPKAFGQFVCGA